MENLELYLIGVSALSLIVGWFLSLEFSKKRAINKIETLNGIIDEKRGYLRELEIECTKKQNQLDRIIDESIVCKHKLLQKSNLLRKKSDELYRVQEKLNRLKSQNQKSQNIQTISHEVKELHRLRAIIIKKDKIIENMRKEYNQKLLQKSKTYIEISKDQFKQIEERLKEYKQKADMLEQENARLVMLSRTQKEFDFFQKLNYSLSNIKEVALSGFFRDNYEKISKA